MNNMCAGASRAAQPHVCEEFGTLLYDKCAASCQPSPRPQRASLNGAES